jgi:N-acetylmuramoyl-L-alanine amidase
MPRFRYPQYQDAHSISLGLIVCLTLSLLSKTALGQNIPGVTPELASLAIAQSGINNTLEFKDYPIVTAKRLELTKEYCQEHYGLDSYELKNPQMIVIHDTEISTLKGSLNAFKAESLPDFRKELVGHGLVNVGIHFVVDQNGDVYRLLPTNVVGRHVIGFNHVALGIENVAGDENHLTAQQVVADVKLVEMLAKKFPTVQYLIGHYEYMHSELPHFKLFKELEKNYKPTIKSDPGEKFMHDLREGLKKDGVVLKD